MAETADIYMGGAGDIWAHQNAIWTRLNRDRLLYERPTPLNAPVYETIEREMIHDTYKPIPFEDFIADLRGKAGKAPDGCPVFVSYDQESDYEGGYYYHFEIGYERPPGDEEKADRKARNAEILEAQAEARAAKEAHEREEFERLRVKFASDSDTRPKDGDAKQAPLASSAGRQASPD